MFGSTPNVGDWIAANETIPLSASDHLTKGGVAPGTRGVVTGRRGNRVDVRFDSTLGTYSATVPMRSVRITRRHGGVEAFERRSSRLTIVRLAALLTMLGPILLFVAQYAWQNHSTEGLLNALAVGVVEGSLELVGTIISHPVASIPYLVLTVGLQRIAFGRRRRD